MDKMFYSIEEAAAKLGKSVDAVKDMASKGQLQEFRDRDKLMFKREQVDLLAGGHEEGDVIPLAGDSGELEPLTLASSGSAPGLAESKESTGISIFEAESTEEADPSAVTRVAQTPGQLVDPGDKSASGSGGLLDLTREADDTSLGADLLGDVYGSETMAQQTTAEPAVAAEPGQLFETPGAAGADMAEAAVGTPMMVVAEPYDGAASGWTGGLMLGAALTLCLAAFTLIIGLTSTAGGGLLTMIGNNYWPFVGGAAALMAIAAGVGFALGKRS
jgi:hypothetical protein